MFQAAAKHYSDFHKFVWLCGILVSVGGAVGVFYGAIRWMTAVWEEGSKAVINLGKIEGIHELALQSAAIALETKQAVDVIQTNHLAHLEKGIASVAESNTELVALTREMRDGIVKLVDRTRDL